MKESPIPIQVTPDIEFLAGYCQHGRSTMKESPNPIQVTPLTLNFLQGSASESPQFDTSGCSRFKIDLSKLRSILSMDLPTYDTYKLQPTDKECTLILKKEMDMEKLKIGEREFYQDRGYYAQIQLAMWILDAPVSCLMVKSDVDHEVIFVNSDENYLANVIPKCRNFYFQYYLPALFSSSQES
ncbi:unnamed protein product [Darwinula stevensoni]|uniref:Uncharacterized protein n=1 Tax=Darwinula stevensoni TaxID=69355 RepID=A0A7R9A713_9CRUS|nr:unnamed protein product [Darwinula stevensoni]CAG0889761.1 unnamed protein product [Darwinula stevensoni]